LVTAFASAAAVLESLHLLLVGPDEGGLKEEIVQTAGEFADRVHFVDYTDAPERYMAACDVFCLPSYREGFGSVIIEAAACGVPAMGSRIYGITDAIEEGKSGLLFNPGDVHALSGCMREMAEDTLMRERMGAYARERAIRDFSSERVTGAWLRYYDELP
ncbi:MAG: glycosyltransferase, partial [Mariprofundaceae bacterium]|nr:glycosyltransferase [Mariprofundaceae bacterium]